MITRDEVRNFLAYTIVALSDIEEILSVMPDWKTLLRHLTMFRDFLKKEYEDQN